jgi:hypothetical protein
MRTAIDVVSRILWAVALLGAGLGIANFASTYVTVALFRSSPDISAPQMAALAAECMVPAIIPYVLARAWDEALRPRRQVQK